MKKVITTVGASLFTNFNGMSDAIKDDYETLKDSQHKDWHTQTERINNIRNNKAFKKWIEKSIYNSCAEISSLIGIAETERDDLNVHLLTTDTVLSRLAAEIIQEILKNKKIYSNNDIKAFFSYKEDVIPCLDIKNVEDFKNKGLLNLIERLKNLGINKECIILNITGGYKGVIPFLTILGQIYDDVDIVYLYEENDYYKKREIIKIPKLPVSFDWVIQEKFYSVCIIHKNIKKNGAKVSGDYILDSDLRMLIEYSEGNKITLTSLGYLLFDKIENEEIESRGVLGFLIEYKLIQYFNASSYRDKNENTYRVIEKPKAKSHYNEEELDLILKKSCADDSEFVVVEVKSYNGRAKLVEQIRRHIKSFKEKDRIPSEYHIIVYSFVYNQLEENKNNLLSYFKENINHLFNEINNCELRLAILHIDWERYKKNENGKVQNPYVGYLGSNDELNIQYIT